MTIPVATATAGNRPRRLSLRRRYLLALVGLSLAGIGGVSAALVVGHQQVMSELGAATAENLQNVLREQFTVRGRSLAAVTAEALVNSVSLYDVEAVREVVRATRADPDVAYVRVQDATGGLLHGTSPVGPDDAAALAAEEVSFQENARLLHLAAPVSLGSQRVGTLQLGLRLDRIERARESLAARLQRIEREHRRTSTGVLAGMAAVLLLLAVLSATVMARRLTRPILALSALAGRIGDGDYEVDMPVARRDELGDLARSFYAMTRRLRETTVSRDHFDSILASMRDGLVVTTPDGLIAGVNPAAEAMIGHASEALVGQPMAALLADGHAAPQRLEKDPHGGLAATASFEASLLAVEGAGLPVVVSVSSLRDHAGAIVGTIYVLHDISERKSAEARLLHVAHHDALTGLPNRALLQDRLVQATTGTRRQHDLGTALLLLDLDHFKEVNDTLGHLVGDQLLKEVAARLRACVSKTDTVARLGGDEFAIVQVGLCGPEDAEAVCRRVVEVLSQPFRLEGRDVFIGASVGVALHPADGDDPNRLLRNADLALYRAKAEGRSTFRFFEHGMNTRLQEQKALEADLRSAIERNMLELHYQPLFDLAQGTLTGFEALLRWDHPERGWVPPDVFVPLAERTGLIVPLGAWVLTTACAQAAGWRALVGRDLRIAVNLSPVQFARQDVAELVAGTLRRTKLPAALLELEITEGTLLQDTEVNLAAMRRLKELGVRIALDDFGTGYSSLGYLRSFPFDTLKIDRSFVRDAGSEPGATAIVRAALGLARSLGMASVAEGIESVDQRQILEAEGCREAQGYYFGRPVPAPEIRRLLLRPAASSLFPPSFARPERASELEYAPA